MDNIEAIARRLLGQPVAGQVDQPNVTAIKQFLKTRQGQEAARSAVDRLVFNYNLGRPPTMPAHKEIVKTLEGIMSGDTGYQQEASAVDPINIQAAQRSGFTPGQDY